MDTGCQRTCLGENFLRRHPNLYNNPIAPHKGRTVSIDGSKVETIGVMNVRFRINGSFYRINARIVRNLVYDFVLGWDFFTKYKCSIHPAEGHLQLENKKVPLIPNSLAVSSSHFSLAEDTVIPPLSKMITQAAFYINPADNITTSDTVEVQPLRENSATVAVGRCISKVNEGRFAVELLNPFDTSLNVKASAILGHVSFTTDEELDGYIEETDITLSYGGEDSGYESEGEEPENDLDTAAASKPARPPGKPPDAKPEVAEPLQELKVDYSTIAEEAKPRLEELKHLLEVKHAKVFSKNERDRGRTDICTYQANVKPGPPIVIRPYRTTPVLQDEMDRQVHDMIADGLVSHSTSPFSAPVLMVKKKMPGQWRLCTDFRKINARSERVVYPLPRIDDTLRKLRSPRFFSTMDLLKGFWQVPIAKEDRKYFAFSTGTLHVEYNVMPMGAVNSTATMQALMALILRGLPPEHIICFLDDILIASETLDDHLHHIDLVLTALGRSGLKLNPQKCLFAQESVSCLGHQLSRDGIAPDPANLAKIKKWKPPTNISEIRSFLGLTGYYRQMIRGYAEIAAPLTDLTKDEKEWKWTEKEQQAFETLRDYLTSDTIMSYPDFSKPFWVKTDASKHSVGFVLTQKDGKEERVIAYGSKKLTETQRGYCTYDREFLGVITAIRTYSHYLRHSKFFVVTDHRPLLNVRNIDPKTDATGRRVRWSIELNLYDFDIIYKKGRKHSDADAMSRLDGHEDYAEEDDLAASSEKGADCALMGLQDNDTITAFELISVEEKRKRLAQAQNADPIIKEVKTLVTRGDPLPADFRDTFYRTNFSRLVVQDDILYRKAYNGSAGLPILQAVLPSALVPEVLKDAHGTIFSGHPGHKRMVDILLRHVTWPGIFGDVKKHVKECPQCDIASQPNPPAKTDLQSMNPEYVFEHVCCDLIELPPARGWKYICVFMDVFSRHVSLYKFRDKSTLTFTRALDDYVSRMGCPTKLTCDNGAEFCSELVDAVTKVLGIKKRTSVVYRPQTQGMVERMNRQLIDQLTKRLNQFGNSWPEHMHYVALAHNASPASRTGETPNLVFFGRELPIPSFVDLSTNTLRSKQVKEYVDEIKRRAKMVNEAVRAHSVKQSEKSAERYNKGMKHTPHEVGDLVYFKQIPKDRTKLDPKYAGPVQITDRSTRSSGEAGTRYTLKYKDGETILRHYDQLKKVHANLKEPISTGELPLKPTPKISLVPFRAQWDSEDDDPPSSPDMPIARRTRSRKIQLQAPNVTAIREGHGEPQAYNQHALTPTSCIMDAPLEPLLMTPILIAQCSTTFSPQAAAAPNTSQLPVSSTPATPALIGPMLGPLVTTAAAIISPCSSVLQMPAGITTPMLSPLILHTGTIQATPPGVVVSSPTMTDQSEPLSENDLLDMNVDSDPASLSWESEWEQNLVEQGLWDRTPPPVNTTPEVEDNNVRHLTAALVPSRSPSSKGSTPEVTQDTMIRVPTPSPQPTNQLAATDTPQPLAQSDLPRTREAVPRASPDIPQPMAQASTSGANKDSDSPDPSEGNSQEEPLSSSKSDDFLYFLDTYSKEKEEEGNSEGKVDIINYKKFEFRRERPANRDKNYQWWICRHKHRYRCPSKLKMFVPHPQHITLDSHVIEYVDHNHAPYRMRTYGKANISIIRDNHGRRSVSTDRLHLSLSRLNSQDLAEDFDSEVLEERAQSTPADKQTAKEEAPLDEEDYTDVVVDTSEVDARGYPIRKISRRIRGLAPVSI